MEQKLVLVGRKYVDRESARCIDCQQPFKFGANVFTREGHLEVANSGKCELCCDSYFRDEE